MVEVALLGDADVVDLARAAGERDVEERLDLLLGRVGELRPSPSKSLTPLYSGGLCEAEMTAPRSSASSATAGVGSTPASTAFPPAATTPRPNASSSSSPEPRVSRPTKTRPPSDQSVAARPELLDELRRQVFADDARTPSVPK